MLRSSFCDKHFFAALVRFSNNLFFLKAPFLFIVNQFSWEEARLLGRKVLRVLFYISKEKQLRPPERSLEQKTVHKSHVNSWFFLGGRLEVPKNDRFEMTNGMRMTWESMLQKIAKFEAMGLNFLKQCPGWEDLLSRELLNTFSVRGKRMTWESTLRKVTKFEAMRLNFWETMARMRKFAQSLVIEYFLSENLWTIRRSRGFKLRRIINEDIWKKRIIYIRKLTIGVVTGREVRRENWIKFHISFFFHL